jgi:hypothetical protein
MNGKDRRRVDLDKITQKNIMNVIIENKNKGNDNRGSTPINF